MTPQFIYMNAIPDGVKDRITEEQHQEARWKIYIWQKSDSACTCFSSNLLRLFTQADGANRTILALAFPALAIAYNNWYWSSCEPEWLEKVKQEQLLINKKGI